jgi:uncharacterized glyoxalase superfamily protein PhnB
MAVKPIPDGYHSITPYLIISQAAALIAFLTEAFGAKEQLRMAKPDGTIKHAELRIGDSVLMLTDAGDPKSAMPSSIFLYVNDVDATYRQAVQAGGQSLREPADQFYGDRMAGVKDPSGNVWWIGTHIEDLSPEELHRRAAAAAAKSG